MANPTTKMNKYQKNFRFRRLGEGTAIVAILVLATSSRSLFEEFLKHFRHLQPQTQPLYSGILNNPGLVRSWQPDAACKGAVPIHSRLPYMCGNTHVSFGITDNDENIPDLTHQLVSDLYNGHNN
uniref:Uncharacterized protein n=1 Tax=Glossina palpalis gambiensis TaxID=67801 RepID=A0A1B0C2B2_9MUSC